ncbi:MULTISPECIES: hypothetical protein [unclassified Shinella]|uniref:hypothetical protein n=1 Tax=unclassified Shinella TaxID=2643062 RepID=UPI00225CAE87|nr:MULTISPECIES: hypothetical protein [unclassified Shinella]MCO5139272.1 hypothetical protein [Shinella sp.]MDC7255999.1 hypothetical protein [Shinella sp. YE25]CAI0338836.1 conserved hypothetical protein [Rhizobiaceae bacterium]CAK7257264.1 HTH marR-type domain-containing protein [Shinella sp. WSC3-e]
MTRKPFPWHKLTPAQIEVMEKITSAGALPYAKLEYRDLVAFEELRKLGLADMKPKGRSKLEAVLTDEGKALQADNYRTEQIVVRVTAAQIDLLRSLNDAPVEDSVGVPINDIPGSDKDICRRMSLRGWVEWYEGWDKQFWAKLTTAGREVLETVDALDEAIAQMADAVKRGKLQ